MTLRRLVRGVAATAFVVLAGGLVVPVHADAQTDQSPPTTVPPLPQPAAPVVESVGPVAWRACDAVGLAFGLTVLSGTLAGAPAEVTVPVNEALAATSGPAFTAVFQACQQVPLSDEPPSCKTDESVPPLPTLGRPLPPFSTLVEELSALEGTLGEVAPGLDGALSTKVAELLACTEGRDPEPDPAPPAGQPTGDELVDPLLDGPGLAPVSGGFDGVVPGAAPSVGTSAGDEPGSSAPAAEQATDAVGSYQPAAASAPASSGAARAYVLLLLTALALGVWGAAGSGRAPDPAATER